MSSTASSPVNPTPETHALSIDSPSSPSSPSKPIPSSPRSTRCLLLTALLTVIAVALLIGLLVGLLTRPSSSSPSTYRAVAVQYLTISNSTSAPTVLSLNLAAYRGIVTSLAAQSPDIIVFPEGGLGYLEADEVSATNATLTRAALLPFCEEVPAPGSTSAVRCDALSSATNPQLTPLSCLAREQSVSLVVNLCQIEHCVPGSLPTSTSTAFPFAYTACPSDGLYYWSSNVVLSSAGAVVAVYAKTHLFDTLSFNIPNPTPVTWTWGGVTFGTLVSFDIEFTQPARSLLDAGVQHVVWTSTLWTNQPPQLTSVMIQQAWAERWGVNLIAANSLAVGQSGGGVYSSGQIANVAFDPAYVAQPGEWLAVVQDIPVQLPASPKPLTSPSLTATFVPPVVSSAAVPCVISAIGEVGNCTFLSAVTSQTVAAQHGDVSCIATAVTNNLSAPLTDYALFASQTSYDAPDTPSSLYLESCTLLYCPSTTPSSSPLPCNVETYPAPIAFTAISVLAALNCSRFAPTVADGGSGEEGTGPAGTVLPMMAVGVGQVVGSAGYGWAYAGKVGGSCWWNATTVQPTSTGLFSMGFYGTDGQADYSV